MRQMKFPTSGIPLPDQVELKGLSLIHQKCRQGNVKANETKWRCNRVFAYASFILQPPLLIVTDAHEQFCEKEENDSVFGR